MHQCFRKILQEIFGSQLCSLLYSCMFIHLEIASNNLADRKRCSFNNSYKSAHMGTMILNFKNQVAENHLFSCKFYSTNTILQAYKFSSLLPCLLKAIQGMKIIQKIVVSKLSLLSLIDSNSRIWTHFC